MQNLYYGFNLFQKKTAIFGAMSFTHNYCRSRIIKVVHARFTQFHGSFTHPPVTYKNWICYSTICVKLRETAWTCTTLEHYTESHVKHRETPWNPMTAVKPYTLWVYYFVGFYIGLQPPGIPWDVVSIHVMFFGTQLGSLHPTATAWKQRVQIGNHYEFEKQIQEPVLIRYLYIYIY